MKELNNMLNNTLLQILKLSRPRFWTYTAGTFLVGFTAGANSLSDFNLRFFVLLLYFLIPANLLIYGINDLFDEEVDAKNIKKNEKELKVNAFNKALVTKAFYISLFLSFLTLVFLKNEISLIFFLVFILLGIFYSAPPFRFKTKPILDFLSNGFYVLPGIIGFYEVSSRFPDGAFIYAGLFWIFSMHLFSAVVDIDADKEAHIKTSATVFGFYKSLFLCFCFWAISWVLLRNSQSLGVLSYLFLVYPVIPIYSMLNKKSHIEKVYWIFPYINTVLGFILYLLAVKELL